MIALPAALVVLTALALRAAVMTTRAHALRLRLEVGPALVNRGRLGNLLPPPPERVAPRLEDAAIDVPPATAWWGWIGGVAVAGFAGLVAGGMAMALLAAGGTVITPLALLRSRRGQGGHRLEAGLPAALEAVARSLRSGASLRQAIEEAGAATPGVLGRELAAVARQAAHGASLTAALEALAQRRPTPGVRLAVAALCLGVETGGAQARAVDGVATTLRDRLGVAAEVRALSSQARMSALVIGLAPLAFAGFAVTTDPRTGQFLFHTPAGIALVVVGVTLDGLGWLWMQRLARVAA